MNNLIKNNPLFSGLSCAGFILPLALSMGVCSGYGAGGALICGIAAAICCFGAGFAPTYLIFLLAQYMSASCGIQATCVAGIFACAIYCVASFCRADKLTDCIKSPAVAGLMLSTAFSLTALQTTNYFGIGADGSTVLNMLVSYRSLGFHANWCGVLYGTIVMVIMITFPRAFKKFSKAVSPALIALAVTLLLNLFLNPAAEKTVIDEVGSYRGEFLSFFCEKSICAADIPSIILYAVAMAFVMVYKTLTVNGSFDASLTQCIGGAACCALGGLPFTACRNVRKIRPISGIIAAAVIAILYVSGVFARIPVHSLAVVIIVGAWQSVDWGKIARAFRGGYESAGAMLISALLAVFAGPAPAVITVGLIGAFISVRTVNKQAA